MDVKKLWDGDISARYALNISTGEIFMIPDASLVVMYPPDVFFDENKTDGRWVVLYCSMVCLILVCLKRMFAGWRTAALLEQFHARKDD